MGQGLKAFSRAVSLRSRFFLSLSLFLRIVFIPITSAAFDDDLEKDLQKGLTQSKVLVQAIRSRQAQGIAAEVELGQLKAAAGNIRITDLLLQERFKLREARAKASGPNALSRHQAMAEGYRAALTRYLGLIDQLPPEGSVPDTLLESLAAHLDKILPKRKRPIIGSLPYRHLNYPAREPSQAPPITPAYKGGNKTVNPDADTRSTPEAPISKEIAALAQSLNWSPVSMYEYVKNNVETEWYWGCMKGAEETLRQKSGNDCDQATLLAALFRASGYPTRYVRGVIEFLPGIERAKHLTGIDDPAGIAELFQKAGIPYKPIIQGGRIGNMQIEHIWVESQIPYANYRGAIIDEHGKTWLGLDTSIKVKGYTYNNPPDILSRMSLSSVRDEYLGFATAGTGTVRAEPPLEYLQSRIISELSSLNSQLTYSDHLRTRTLIPEVMNILPGNTQFTLVKATNEYIEIPEELKHRVRFTAMDASKKQLFTITLDLVKVSNQKIILCHEPETVEDQETINAFGGLANTPAYLVRLRPMLLVNDERIVVAGDGAAMGADYNLTVSLISPSGTESFTNAVISGNTTAIGIAAQKAIEPGMVDEQKAQDLLWRETLRYLSNWTVSENELSSLLHLTLARPIPMAVTIAGVIEVSHLLDRPNRLTWKGVYCDADLRAVEMVGINGNTSVPARDRNRLYLQLSSLQGSVLEHRLFEDDFKVESISTAKLFQLVNSQAGSAGIVTIDQSNIGALLPTLSVEDNIKDELANSVNQNLTVRIPQSEITYRAWTGVGYVTENFASGEAGWMLSGMIAGSESAVSPEAWVDKHLEQMLSQPRCPESKRRPACSNQDREDVVQ